MLYHVIRIHLGLYLPLADFLNRFLIRAVLVSEAAKKVQTKKLVWGIGHV